MIPVKFKWMCNAMTRLYLSCIILCSRYAWPSIIYSLDKRTQFDSSSYDISCCLVIADLNTDPQNHSINQVVIKVPESMNEAEYNLICLFTTRACFTWNVMPDGAEMLPQKKLLLRSANIWNDPPESTVMEKFISHRNGGRNVLWNENASKTTKEARLCCGAVHS